MSNGSWETSSLGRRAWCTKHCTILWIPLPSPLGKWTCTMLYPISVCHLLYSLSDVAIYRISYTAYYILSLFIIYYILDTTYYIPHTANRIPDVGLWCSSFRPGSSLGALGMEKCAVLKILSFDGQRSST